MSPKIIAQIIGVGDLMSHKDIYKVENGKLFKIGAPEGTIIEIREVIQ